MFIVSLFVTEDIIYAYNIQYSHFENFNLYNYYSTTVFHQHTITK